MRETIRGKNFEIYKGDALSILQSLPSDSVDAVITDEPYSSGGTFRGDRMNDTAAKYVQTGTLDVRDNFLGDNRDQRAFMYWCALWLCECLRIAKVGSPICLFSDWRQLPTVTDAMQIGGFVWRGIVPWNKTEAARPQYGRFRQQCEYVVWGSNGPMLTEGKPMPGFFTYIIKQSDKFHQTGKPTPLMVDIMDIVPAGGVVLDPFMGSASTGVGALRTGRKFIGCELTNSYFNIAAKRLKVEEAQGLLFPPSFGNMASQAGLEM